MTQQFNYLMTPDPTDEVTEQDEVGTEEITPVDEESTPVDEDTTSDYGVDPLDGSPSASPTIIDATHLGEHSESDQQS
ncbi:MAG: hypothetical protein WAS07_15655 [Micropruina sp.]|nr:hypothetical protein [Micropruina sp.]